MPYNEKIISKVRATLYSLTNVTEKKMFGKLAFMVNGKLCIAVGQDGILCRINPSLHVTSVLKTGCRPVIMKGKEMKGYVYLNNSYLQAEEEVKYWINLCLEYNKTIT